MTSAYSIFDISDGTTTVDLLGFADGIMVKSWQPLTPPQLETARTSPFQEGRQLVDRKFDTTFETIALTVSAGSFDNVAHELQELRRLLEQAADYWTKPYSGPTVIKPVYLKVQGRQEQYPRYAWIHSYRQPNEQNPFFSPLWGRRATMTDVNLIIEHGLWSDNLAGACIELSATHTWKLDINLDTIVDLDANDQEADNVGMALADGASIRTGGAQYDGLFRFETVTVPNAAVISNAYLVLRSTNNTAAGTVLSIVGEDADTSPVYVNYADYAGRAVTAAAVAWTTPALTAGTAYQTPNIATVIQEIVNRGGWASGNNISIFILDTGAGPAIPTWDAINVGWQTTLHIEYESSVDTTIGQADTCNRTVYVANHQKRTQIEWAYYYDASTGLYSGNLMGAALPTTLLPAVPAVGDYVMFGATDNLGAATQFCSLVFDLSTGTTVTGVWEFQSGAPGAPAWTGLTTTDNTTALTLTGINSVHWTQGILWLTQTLNGINTWWIRFRVTAIPGVVPPVQANRRIYTAVQGAALATNGTTGDTDLLVKWTIENVSGTTAGVAPFLNTMRLIAGLRSTERGANFSAYINLTNQENPTGVATATVGASLSTVASSASVTGAYILFNPAAIISAYISVLTGDSYSGRFRAFLRCQQVGGTLGDITAYLSIYNSSVLTSTKSVSPTILSVIQALDLGIVDLTGSDHALYNELDSAGILVYVSNTAAAGFGDLYIYDLILIPIDEWSGDWLIPNYPVFNAAALIGGSYNLKIDSLKYPKQNRIAYKYSTASSKPTNQWQARVRGPAILLPRKNQKLWMLAEGYDNTQGYYPWEITHRLELDGSQRWFGLRGRDV